MNRICSTGTLARVGYAQVVTHSLTEAPRVFSLRARRLWRAIGSSSAALLWFASPLTARGQTPTRVQIAWIENYNPDDANAAGNFEVRTSDAQSMKIYRGAPLSAGDTITVKRAGYILVTLESGSSFKVCGPNTNANAKGPDCGSKSPPAYPARTSPCELAAPTHVPGITHAVFAWMAGNFSAYNEKSQTVETVSAVLPRGDDIAVAIFSGDQEQLVSTGVRTVRLSWLGGTPSFTIDIRNLSTGELALSAVTSERRLEKPRVAFGPGRYVVSIRGSTGRQWQKAFRVVAADSVPKAPEELQRSPAISEKGRAHAAASPEAFRGGVSRDFLATAEAAWLASQGDGRWTWEAALCVADIAPSYEPAQALARALEQGARPPSL